MLRLHIFNEIVITGNWHDARSDRSTMHGSSETIDEMAWKETWMGGNVR